MRKQFEVAHRAHLNGDAPEPVEFDLKWEDDKGKSQSETFSIHPERVSQFLMFRIAGSPISNDALSWLEVFQKTMDPPEYTRFATFCQDTDGVEVKAENLADIVAWIMEEATARPTMRSLPSAPGPKRTTKSSTPVAS